MPQKLRWLALPILAGLVIGLSIIVFRSQISASSTNSPGYADAFAEAAPAVVNIYTSKIVREQRSPLLNDPILRYFFGQGDLGKSRQREKVERSLGSGVIVSADGFLLTNRHVIQDADEILALLHDGRQAIAQLIGSDPETDLAVLKINLPDLKSIPLGDSTTVRVGDIVLAIGNPYGFGQSMSQGIVSAKGRYGLGLANYENFIQTDAAINPGNSGGALVDYRGSLIGINTAIYTQSGGSTGIGLAIPSELALRTMADIIRYGRPLRGWLGLEVQSIPQLNDGVIISALIPGGPATRAGLLIGDIIFAIDDTPIGDGHAGMKAIGETRPGDTVTLEIGRGGKRTQLDIVVGTRPTPSS